MDIKKGLLYVAAGFFFTLVNLNITLNGSTFNLTPEFVGWILMFLAFDRLGTYVEGKRYLKWISLILAIVTAGIWLMALIKPELSVFPVNTIASLMAAFYEFVLFGCLQKIAADYGSKRADTLGMLRIINLVLYLGLTVTGFLAAMGRSAAYAGVFILSGACALVAAVATMVVLFKLNREISEMN